ncbi:MAG: class I SAM-dependent methyltransferase [Candidatus Eiseniibacteriota bacterium]
MSPTYVLGHSERELERLATQAALVNPMTRRYFAQAGVAAGMRVLDVGCGPGDVSILVADMVGPKGEVVGVDRSPVALATARARIQERSLSQVSFREGDPGQMTFDRPFDAVVGRYVLMFQTDPAVLVRGVAQHLKPGGILVFHEVDWDGVASKPPAPIHDQCCRWICEVLDRTGHDKNMGKRLHKTYIAAGLPPPSMDVSALIGGGVKNVEELNLIVGLMETMLPAMEAAGVTTSAEVGLETLADRMIREAANSESVIMGRFEVGAWTRKE